MPMADAPMPAADGEAIRARLAAAADSVRHPALGLGRFTAGLDDLAGEDEDEDEDEDGCVDDPDAEEHVAEAEREPARLRLRSQCGLRQTIEQLNRGAGDPEDLPAAPSEGDPGFERRHALRAQPFDQRLRQIVWQCMRHAGQSSQFV